MLHILFTNSVLIHQRNLQVLEIEVFKVNSEMEPCIEREK